MGQKRAAAAALIFCLPVDNFFDFAVTLFFYNVTVLAVFGRPGLGLPVDNFFER
jgi:hypothetical protein